MDAPAPVASGPPPVLWTPNTLRPLLEAIVPAAEKLALAQLRAEAVKLSPAAERLVAEKGRWGEVAVAALKEGGAALGAKYMNLTGISAEYAPEVQFGAAVASVLVGHLTLLEELRALAVAKRNAIDVPSKVVPQPNENQHQGPERGAHETRVA